MDIKYIGGDIPWSLPFGNHFNSSRQISHRNSVSELETIARRHDFEPLYSNNGHFGNNSKWMNSGIFFANKTIASNLTGVHKTDFHDDHQHTFCYLCTINQHVHEHMKPRDESKRQKLIPYKNPKARSSSALDRILQDSSSSSSNLVPYRFIVRTDTRKNSGTRAQVFLYMYGTEKNWTSINLQPHAKQNSSASVGGFPSGSIRTFCLKGPDIGQLHHLNVNLIGSRSDKEWFLKEIEITNLNTSVTWLCEFNCWLPKHNEQEHPQIKPNVIRQSDISSDKLAVYILQVRTGEKSFTGADSTVQIIVRGSASQTHRLALTSNRVNLFEQKQLDTFAIIGWDIGDLLEITVESDRSQFASDWDIKEMTMWKLIPHSNDKQFHVYFPFNTWLGKKISTLKAKVETYPMTDYHLKGPICYQVMVKTGKVMNAGTDANVFLIIYGKTGRTTIHHLDNRLQNDFERNSMSEFTIMDIDVGQIDRIKMWHDNSSPGSAWFLDSVIIRKKHSTCHVISNIYMHRLEQISKSLYRQVHGQLKKNFHVQTPPTNVHERHSNDRRSLKSKDYDDDNQSNHRLGSSRGILRSPIMYDKASLQKKVTWDEQSIGSQDDLFSFDAQSMKAMQNISEQKHKKQDSSHKESGHFDHQVYWISSHSYIDNKWQIKSIEEMNSLDLDQPTRSLLLSDRLTINDKIKTPNHENDDEIYEFEANRWLAKDKEDRKVEVYLTPKLTHQTKHQTSDTVVDSKKKHLVPADVRVDSHHKKYDDYLKESKLGSSERSPAGLASHDLRLSSSRLPDTSKIQLNNPRSLQRNVDPLTRQSTALKQQEEPAIDKLSRSSSSNQRLKSPRSINDPLTSERELLERISGEPPYHPRSSATSLLSSSRLSKSPHNTADLSTQLSNERESLARVPDEPPYHLRSSDSSLPPSNRLSKSPRSVHDIPGSLSGKRESLARLSGELPSYPRSSATSLLSSNRPSKSPHSTNDLTTRLTHEREPSARVPDEPPYHHLLSSGTSLPPSNRLPKSPRNTNDLTGSLAGERESLGRIPGELPNYPRSSASSLLPSNRPSKSPYSATDLTNSLTNERESLARISGEPPNHLRSSGTSLPPANRLSTSPRSVHDLADSLNNEREPLARLTGEPPSYPRSSATSLLSSNRPSKSPHSTNDLTTRLTHEREPSARVPDEPPYHHLLSSGTSLPPSNRLPKSPRNTNDLTGSLTGERESLGRMPDELPNYPRSSASSLLSSDRPSKSSRGVSDLTNPLTNERESLSRLSDEPPYNLRSSDTSLPPYNQLSKSPRSTNNLAGSLTGGRESLTGMPDELPTYPRSTVLSSQYSKPTLSTNDLATSLSRTSVGPPSRPKSAARSNLESSSQKSVHDQVYKSPYGTAPADDF